MNFNGTNQAKGELADMSYQICGYIEPPLCESVGFFGLINKFCFGVFGEEYSIYNNTNE